MHIELPRFCNHEEEYEKRLIIMKNYLDILSAPHSDSDCDKIDENELSCRHSTLDMFTIVYQICLIKCGKNLYTEIMNYCYEQLFKFDNMKLEEAGNWPTSLAYKVHYGHCLPHIQATKFLLEFHQILKRFVHLVGRLDAIVVYHLDRTYVGPTFHTNLKDRLNKAFCSEVCFPHMKKLVSFTRSHPHAIGHQIVAELDELIFKVNPEVRVNPEVAISREFVGMGLLEVVDRELCLSQQPQTLTLDLVDNEPNQLQLFDQQCLEFHNFVRNVKINLFLCKRT